MRTATRRGLSSQLTFAAVAVFAASCHDATGTPEAPGMAARLVALPGVSTSGLMDHPVNAPPLVQVLDASGAPVAGVSVLFTVEGGPVAGGARITGGDGIAGVENWTLVAGPNTVTASVPGSSVSTVTFRADGVPADFDVAVRVIGRLTVAQQQAVSEAVGRWQRAIYRDLPAGSVSLPAGACGSGVPELIETIDDVLVLVQVAPIDGAGGVLGTGGVCALRSASLLPLVGLITLDADDADGIAQTGHLAPLVLHELGHALGFGTVWPAHGLLADPVLGGGVDPHFTGTAALAAFERVGGSSYDAGLKVPVENAGGPGTADAHWRESVFGSELMTGYLTAGQNHLSAATVAAMGDLGYTVSHAVAEDYDLGLTPGLLAGVTIQIGADVLRAPLYYFDASGRLTLVRGSAK